MTSAIPAEERQPAVADSSRNEAAAAAALVSVSTHLLGTDDPALAGFFAAFTRYASPEDLLHYAGNEFAALLRRIFAKVRQRKAGESLIEFFDSVVDPQLKRGETVLLAVNDDMPFLYDSCMAEIRAQGRRVLAGFHPVMRGFRDDATPAKQSVIVVALGGMLDETSAGRLHAALMHVFADVAAAVRDWQAMLARLAESREALIKNPPRIPTAEIDENVAFLDWLRDNHFTFLGCRDYRFSRDADARLNGIASSGLGVLSDPSRRVLRSGNESSDLGPAAREFLNRPAPLIIAKSGRRSTVHRRVPMDYVGIKSFGPNGQLTGERRFVGLFTSVAYHQLPAEIPLLRRKTAHVMAGSGLLPASHDGKAVQHILDTFPRDELFQISEEELLATVARHSQSWRTPQGPAFSAL